MTKIGIIGYKGYVGKNIYQECIKRNLNVVGIDRENFMEKKNDHYDILINSAMPSKRFWALNNPMEDFYATVELTAGIVYEWKYKKLIHISSVSARCQIDHPYGLNKKCSEELVLHSNKENLVIRLGSMFGDGLEKGVLIDILNNNQVFVSKDSRYNFINIKKSSVFICDRFEQHGVIDIGSKDTISISSIVKHLGIKRPLGSRIEVQETEDPAIDFPSATEVFGYLDEVVIKNSGFE
jgi:nucleoside-diphosphate-sugar epimerase